MEILGKIRGGISQGKDRVLSAIAETREKASEFLRKREAREDSFDEFREAAEIIEEEPRAIRDRVEIFGLEVKTAIKNRREQIRERIISIQNALSVRDKIAIILIIGVAGGIGIKLLAIEYATMGYYDYTGSNGKAYNLIEMQKEVAEKSKGSGFSGGAPNAGACSQ